jgi:mRNA-degrading endonuclease RelE of RelBE toxin-antitoxin system
MTWTVIVGKSAQKALEKIPVRDQDRIAAALIEMVADPFVGDIRKLEGVEDRWRRRAGSYRIFFGVNQSTRTIAVSAILRRTSATY